MKKLGATLVEKMDVPAESISGLPQVVLLGDIEVTVEGYKSILEYGENAISLDCGKILVEILGTGLHIKNFTKSFLRAAGKILSVSFRV